MYFIKRIRLNSDEQYEKSILINHTYERIKSALYLLENCVKSFVFEERGRDAMEQARIIDIHDFSQVTEPAIDSILLYRLSSDPHKIYVYQRKTSLIKRTGWLYNTVDEAISKFHRTDIFELESYEKIKLNIDTSKNNSNNDETIPILEMVSIGPAHIKIPKEMTISPICDVINELKNSPKFKARLGRSQSVIIPIQETAIETQLTRSKSAVLEPIQEPVTKN
jgi:hypothetical protein